MFLLNYIAIGEMLYMTMWYEAKKLQVMLVSGEIGRVRTPFFFLGMICIYKPKYGILSSLAKTIWYGIVFKPE